MVCLSAICRLIQSAIQPLNKRPLIDELTGLPGKKKKNESVTTQDTGNC